MHVFQENQGIHVHVSIWYSHPYAVSWWIMDKDGNKVANKWSYLNKEVTHAHTQNQEIPCLQDDTQRRYVGKSVSMLGTLGHNATSLLATRINILLTCRASKIYLKCHFQIIFQYLRPRFIIQDQNWNKDLEFCNVLSSDLLG